MPEIKRYGNKWWGKAGAYQDLYILNDDPQNIPYYPSDGYNPACRANIDRAPDWVKPLYEALVNAKNKGE
jgi:hypothetical protein